MIDGQRFRCRRTALNRRRHGGASNFTFERTALAFAPRLSRVAFFGTSTWAGNALGLRETELAARTLGVELQYVDVSRPKDFVIAFQAAGKGQAEAVIMLVWNPLINPR
jgi:hypothetical protein